MNEKLVLQLLAEGRLSVDETLALLGHAEPPRVPQIGAVPQRIRRNKPVQRKYSGQDHSFIVATFCDENGDCKAAGERLGIPSVTVRRHAKYAGLIPAIHEGEAHSIMIWRKRRNMYLDLPRPTIGEEVPNLFKGKSA